MAQTGSVLGRLSDYGLLLSQCWPWHLWLNHGLLLGARQLCTEVLLLLLLLRSRRFLYGRLLLQLLKPRKLLKLQNLLRELLQQRLRLRPRLRLRNLLLLLSCLDPP